VVLSSTTFLALREEDVGCSTVLETVVVGARPQLK
jgi:hypothetical protein